MQMIMEPVYIERTETVDAARLKELGLPALIGNANMLRRMSRMVRMGVAAGMLCLDGIPNDAIGAIVTATCLGGLEDTEKFLAEISERNEAGLNPTPFMRSVFNTVGAQIALLKGIKVYNVTYVHRTASFENALSDALMLISEGRRNVLAGAFDEMTPSSVTVKERLGLPTGLQAVFYPGRLHCFMAWMCSEAACQRKRPGCTCPASLLHMGSLSQMSRS